jgi:HK97 family phage portal protein
MLPFRRSTAKTGPVRPPETKDSAVGPLIAMHSVGRPVWSARDAATLIREGFAKNPIAYRCVRMIAEAAASAPLVVFDKGERAAGEHPLQRLLDRPNPEQSGVDLMESFYGALQCAGDGYLEAAGDGQPDELYNLRPDRMQAIPGPRGWPEAYQYSVDGRSVRLGRRSDGFLPVLHLKLLNPGEDYYGLSPLAAAARAVDIHNASSAWNKALLDNAARPSGALVYGGGHMAADQWERLKAELRDAHAGAHAAGVPLMLEGGLDWKPMSLTPQEMDFIEGKHVAAREIALAFGVPPQLLGIPGDATYNTYREANAAFWRGVVIPLAGRAARALTGWLGPKFDGASVAVDLDQVPALSVEREALWARLESASFLTPDERRRMAGLTAALPDNNDEVDHG